ncbi:MAG: hypothetical protein ACREIW_02225, partial [Chthoniobacterales bacterium]
IKAWQARRHAYRAFTYIQNEKWNEGQKEASAAYQLAPTEPQALRAVARFLSRIHQSEALDFWKQLEERQPLTREDRRDEIAAALSVGDLSAAQFALEELLAREDSPPSATDWLLAAQVAQQDSETARARELTKKVLDDLHADERDQYQAALLMLALSSTENAEADSVEAGWAHLEKLAKGKTKTALASLVILAQRALSDTPSTIDHQPSVAPKSGESGPVRRRLAEGGSTIAELIRALESHPLAKTAHKLLALDLQMHAHPAQRDALISRGIANWKNADTASLVALATWLDDKGEYQRQLDAIPAEKALRSRDLFLLRLDALSALGRWTEIKQLLESEHFPLDQVAERMYVARCNAQLGEKTASENNWKRALEAAGDDSGKLMTLAEYAQRNGANAIAEVAYASAANASPKLRAAWQGRLRIAQASGDTRKMHDVLTDMLAIWPNDRSIQNDEAYIRLLLLFSNSRNDEAAAFAGLRRGRQISNGERMKQIEELAEKLVEQNPHSLPHRSLLALARLRENRAAEALEAYTNIHVAPNALTPSALAVHAAVLAANDRTEDARAEAGQIKIDSLLPEEKVLIQNLL